MAEIVRIIRVYRDESKAELVEKIRFPDLGNVVGNDGTTVPTSDEGLIHYAKTEMRGTGHEDADSLYYEVEPLK